MPGTRRLRHAEQHPSEPERTPGVPIVPTVGGVHRCLFAELALSGLLASFSDPLEISRMGPPNRYRKVQPVAQKALEHGEAYQAEKRKHRWGTG